MTDDCVNEEQNHSKGVWQKKKKLSLKWPRSNSLLIDHAVNHVFVCKTFLNRDKRFVRFFLSLQTCVYV